MAEIIELMTELRMNSSEFTAKINEAKAQISEFSRESESRFSSFGFGVGTVAVTAIAGLGYEVAKTSDKLNTLYETSRKLGTSAGDLQTLQSAFKGFGVEGDSVVRMMGFIQKSIGDTRLGIGQAGDAFKKLGLNVKELAGMGAPDQITMIAQAIGKLKDKTQQMAIARQIAGRGGIDLLGAARGDLAGAIAQYKGLQIDDETAESAHKFVEQLNYAEAVAESLGYKLISHLSSWVDDLKKAVTDASMFINDHFNNFNSTDPDNPKKLTQLNAQTKLMEGGSDWNYKGAGPGRLQTIASTGKDPWLQSAIPNFMSGSKVSQKVKSQIDDLGDSAEKASKKLKDMSETGKLLEESKTSGIKASLKRILGDDLKTPTISRTGDKDNPYSELLAQEMQRWDSDVKQLFESIKQYGDTPENERQLKNLKSRVSGIDDPIDVGVINDLQKYAKEQGKKKQQIEVTVHWDKGLSGSVKVSDGQGVITDGVKSIFAQEASGMGK